MKTRFIAILVLVALVGAMAFVATRYAFMGDVSYEEFDEFIRDYSPSQVVSHRPSSATRLPLLVSLRFPRSSSTGGFGFSDSSYVYTFASTSGEFECHAHVCRYRVCHITFERSPPPSKFTDELARKFPKLSASFSIRK